MGVAKSHGLVVIWHLDSQPHELADTDIGRAVFAGALRIADGEVPSDLSDPQVVVLACDNMMAGQSDVAFDGPAQSLHERFLWRLFGFK